MVTCTCGAKLEIPTLAGISRLAEAPSVAAGSAHAHAWGLKQALSLLGVALLLGAAAMGLYLWHTWPVELVDLPPTVQEIELYVATHTVGDLWRQWKEFREMPLDGHRPRPDALYPQLLLRHRLWTGAATVMLLAGLGLLLAAALLPKHADRATASGH
jgi:hypothetical protein